MGQLAVPKYLRRIGIGLGIPLLAGCAGQRPHVRPLTPHDARSGQPAWSHDGVELLHVSNRSGTWQLWLLDLRSGATTQLTHEAGPVGGPRWAPDGAGIWYYAQVDGTFVLRTTDRLGTAPRTIPTPLRDAFRPVPHPAGPHLLFDGVAHGGGDHDLYVQDLRSGVVQRLTTDPGYDSDGRWSPDGEWIAFHSDRGADRHAVQLYRMRTDGTAREALTFGPAIHGYPAWSPSGRCLAYSRESGSARTLWILELATRAHFPLPRPAMWMGEPAFHPDGQHLAAMMRTESGAVLVLISLPEAVREACTGTGG